MRKVLLGATAALAFVAPGVASAETSGHVGASFANTDVDDVDDFDTYGIEGAVVTDVGTGWLLQFDGSSYNVDDDAGTGGAYVHFGKRGSGHALAGFAGLTNFFGTSIATFGGEGQLFFSNVTVNGSAVYGNLDEADIDFWNLHLDGTFFVSENFGVTGGVNHSTADSSGTEFDWTTWSADAEYRFGGSPLSVFGGYAYTDFDDSGASADTLRIGLRYDFGTNSVQARSQTGASLNGANAFASQLRFPIF